MRHGGAALTYSDESEHTRDSKGHTPPCWAGIFPVTSIPLLVWLETSPCQGFRIQDLESGVRGFRFRAYISHSRRTTTGTSRSVGVFCDGAQLHKQIYSTATNDPQALGPPDHLWLV